MLALAIDGKEDLSSVALSLRQDQPDYFPHHGPHHHTQDQHERYYSQRTSSWRQLPNSTSARPQSRNNFV